MILEKLFDHFEHLASGHIVNKYFDKKHKWCIEVKGISLEHYKDITRTYYITEEYYYNHDISDHVFIANLPLRETSLFNHIRH